MTTGIREAGDWRYVAGCAFGVPQSVMLGMLQVEHRDHAAIARALSTLFEEPLPGLPAGIDGPEAVAWLFAACTGAIQREARISVHDAFRVRPLPASQEAGPTFELALATVRPRASLAAIGWSIDAFNRIIEGSFDADAARTSAIDNLKAFADPGVNNFLIARAAHELDIPLAYSNDFLVLGTGVHSRWMRSTITDATSSIGVSAAKRKHQTAWMLREAGLPGAQNVLVASAEAALDAARQLGFPVVVKPADREKGDGVAADLRDEAQVTAAFDEALKFSRNVLVERWFPGYTHRLNVFQGTVNRVARRVAGGVVGDGVLDIARLVDAAQDTDWHRRLRSLHGRQLLVLDDEARSMLRQDGRDERFVPAAGEYVRLRRRDNINAGGHNDELDAQDPAQVHPDNVRLAVDAARTLRLDIAGIDLIMGDISKSWLATGALICEVNAQPQILRPLVVRQMVGDLVGGTGRIPAQLFVASQDTQRRKALLQHLASTGLFHGISDRAGLRVGGHRVTGGFRNGMLAGRALLMRTDVTSAACVMMPADILQHGLPLERWDRVHCAPVDWFDGEEAEQLDAVRRFVAEGGPV